MQALQPRFDRVSGSAEAHCGPASLTFEGLAGFVSKDAARGWTVVHAPSIAASGPQALQGKSNDVSLVS